MGQHQGADRALALRGGEETTTDAISIRHQADHDQGEDLMLANIRARETVIRYYEVEADSPEDAELKYNNGELASQATADADMVNWEAESITPQLDSSPARRTRNAARPNVAAGG